MRQPHGQKYDAGRVHNLCTACNRPLWVKYDLVALRAAFPKSKLAGRPPTLWRYLEMLPIKDPAKIVSLVETISPILETRRLGTEFGVQHLLVKDREPPAHREFQIPRHGHGHFQGQ